MSSSALVLVAVMRVAVLEFGNGGGASNLDSLGKGLQSMVTTDLAQVPSFELVERARLKDISAEIKLQRTGLVNKATAVQIGKLAGATHLVTGTFTVVGGKMRLDTRLFAVADGRVLLAEQIEGERDAFFELEKQLVGKLIGAAGVKLEPKQRAEVARVHTADFEAFRKFSDGIAAFDKQQYDAAVAALHEAESRDADFKLAATTLADYERAISELRTKADAIAAAQAQKEQLEQGLRVKDELGMIQKLYAASTKGPPLERLAALAALALIYGTSDGYGHHDKLRQAEDEFALQRTAETLFRSYFAEAVKVFPQVPLSPSIELSSGLPKPGSVDANLAALVDSMKNFQAGGFNHEESLLYFSLVNLHDLARRLLLDRREEADLRARALELAAPLHPKADWIYDRRLELAQNLREVSEYGKSSALLTSLGASTKEPMKLQELAREIEKNRDMQQAAEKSPVPRVARELLVTMPNAWNDDVQADTRARLATLTRLGPWERYLITRARRFRDEREYVIVDGSPVWRVRGNDEVVATGPRTDPLRASELRYYRPSDGEAMLILDGVPRRDLDVRYELSYAVPDDWWPGMDNPGKDAKAKGAPLVAHRPEVAFAFGVRDIQSDTRPLRLYQLVVTEAGVRLEGGGKVLGTQALDLRTAVRVTVAIKLAGNTLAVTVNDKTLSFPAPADRLGFYGFAMRGPGYACVKSWRLRL